MNSIISYMHKNCIKLQDQLDILNKKLETSDFKQDI